MGDAPGRSRSCQGRVFGRHQLTAPDPVASIIRRTPATYPPYLAGPAGAAAVVVLASPRPAVDRSGHRARADRFHAFTAATNTAPRFLAPLAQPASNASCRQPTANPPAARRPPAPRTARAIPACGPPAPRPSPGRRRLDRRVVVAGELADGADPGLHGLGDGPGRPAGGGTDGAGRMAVRAAGVGRRRGRGRRPAAQVGQDVGPEPRQLGQVGRAGQLAGRRIPIEPDHLGPVRPGLDLRVGPPVAEPLDQLGRQLGGRPDRRGGRRRSALASAPLGAGAGAGRSAPASAPLAARGPARPPGRRPRGPTASRPRGRWVQRPPVPRLPSRASRTVSIRNVQRFLWLFNFSADLGDSGVT